MPPGTYALGGQEVIVDGISARLVDGTLAGSLLTMDQAVRNMAQWNKPAIPKLPGQSRLPNIAHALYMASASPARLLGLPRHGTIIGGADADIVLLDEDLHVQMTIIGGEIVYRREGA